jgi:hypothetical protein
VMKRSKNRYHYEYKKCRKVEKRIKRSKLLDACVCGDGDLFSELKKLRHTRAVWQLLWMESATMLRSISRTNTNNFTTQQMMVES